MLKTSQFSAVFRKGSVGNSPSLTVHLCKSVSQYPLVGLVVPKKQVSLATHRNRIKRRLRHILAAKLHEFSGLEIVVRVKAPAQGLTSTQLSSDFLQAFKIASSKQAKLVTKS